MDAAATALETLTPAAMRADVARLLDAQPTDVADEANLLSLGLDSVRIMTLASQWRVYGVELKFADLVAEPTLAAWARLAQGAGAVPAEQDATPRAEPADGAPFDLTPIQLAYWVGRGDAQVLGGIGAHFYCEFDGLGVDPQALERAVRAAVDRHDMLRARFLDDGRQVIEPAGRWAGLTTHDLRAAGVAADSELDAIRERLSHRRLAVEEGEVFDVQLSLLPGERTRVHVGIDMLVADATSFRILLADLARLYARPAEPLRELDYDFARYLADREQSSAYVRDRERGRAYWRERLAGLPAGPELPLARAPETIESPRVRRLYRHLDGDGRGRLTQYAAAHGITLATTFLTAFSEVLAAWSAQPRFLLTMPLYDRSPIHPDAASIVGDFTSLVLLEVDTTPEATFAERARALQEQLHRDIDHAAYSGVDVLRDLARHHGRAVAAPVVFTSALSLGELFDADVRAQFGKPGWTISQTPQVWLDHQVTEVDGGLLLNWDVVDGLLAEGAVEAMFAAYVHLLDGLADSGSSWEAPTAVGLPEEQQAVRERVNATAAPESGALLHERFFAHARTTPDAPALMWGEDEVLTYGALAQRALAIAGALAARGVRPGEPVAITLPKGPAQVEAVLGILAAGGVYVPVGVDQPPVRRELMYASADVRFAVTTGAGAESGGGRVEALSVEELRRGDPLSAPVGVWDEMNAYVMFTSGSTGTPKGVVVSHRAAVNTIDDLNARLAIDPTDRALALSALEFDLSVYDVFGMLAAGAGVVAVGEGERRDAHAWARLMRRHGVTVLNCVPALLDMLLTALDEEPAELSLRAVLLGGDWVTVDLRHRVERARPGCRFLALGGTTETAIHSTVCDVPVDVPTSWRTVPYGAPLRNVRCRVVDTRGRDRPDWVPGELWIGGAGVARGYQGDAGRTAERFVDWEGLRWYRTGDLARYWPDGTIEFLGRDDFQIKLRGHRIELGEIEAALAQHPQVEGAVATLDASGRQLAAVVAAAAPISADVLRVFAAERLPPPMVPARVVQVEALPLTGNGKIDRVAARALVESGDAERAREAPRGVREQTVAREWRQLLEVPEVDRRDSFFALGGDSLLATRLVARLARAGYRAELQALFAQPALCDFAATLREDAAAAPAVRVHADPAARFEPFPSTETQRAYWLGRRTDFVLGGVGSHWYWEFDGEDVDLDQLENVWNRLVQRHDMLRAVFDDDGMQRVLPEVVPIAIRRRRVASAAAEDAFAALRAELAHQVFDVTRWPLFEIGVVSYGTRSRIAFSFDYIVFDALSIMIVFAELGRLYADPGCELPPLGITFRDYVLSVVGDGESAAAAREHWLARLDTLPAAPRLPLAVEPAAVERPRFVRRAAELPADRWERIVERARHHGVTPAAVLATAYADVLARWSASRELTLMFTRFDRDEIHPDVYSVVGDFTSLMLVSHQPVPGEPWVERVRRLQHEIWTGIEHGAVSALWVLRELARRRAGDDVTVPVVFTSALGVAPEAFDLSLPFGDYVWGLSQTPQVWLDHQVVERGGRLAYNWDAVGELFPEGVLDSMFSAYGGLLGQLASPEHDWAVATCVRLPAHMLETRARVNATAAPQRNLTLHEPFFAHAESRPDATAVAWQDGELSYGELARRARRVAALLYARGVRPGDLVGVTIPKGHAQVEAVLGVLAAGAAYVPVGVDQPASRRDRIYAGARVTHVLVEQVDACGATSEPVVVGDAAAVDEAPPVAVEPDALAYVIYTSGSSGEPKGVMMTHRAAANTIEDVCERFGVAAADRVLAVSALDFDLSVFDVFGLLAVGGTIVLPDEDGRCEAGEWLALLEQHRVTIWNSVPVLLEMLLAHGEPARAASLRLALLSGDWIPADLPSRVASAVPSCRFVALGGATEAAVWSNAFEVGGPWPADTPIPYGSPLRNQEFRVVADDGGDCPDWVPGELWIGGAGVAAGYLGDPQMTAQRFVCADGRRWYRTGDVGRYRPDGVLEFLGRADEQVKLRGHRIELGEIEAALAAHSLVAAAAVVAVGSPVERLAGYVVPVGADLDVGALGADLRARLPVTMIPTIETIDRLPLNANAKVDRVALRRMAESDRSRARAAAAPESALEEAVAELWEELLAIESVGRDDSFFAVGGDSLTATRLVAELRRLHGVELTLREILSAPTVADVAALLEARAPRKHAYEEGVV
jgi:amino acid adenylation domain-containing protein